MGLLKISANGCNCIAGGALVDHIEEELSRGRARLLLVETSGLMDFEAARAFYSRHGFALEARISDYYASGEDKLIYVKKLSR